MVYGTICEDTQKKIPKTQNSLNTQPLINDATDKLGCVVRMVVDSILPHVECGPNDHLEDAPPFKIIKNCQIKTFSFYYAGY